MGIEKITESILAEANNDARRIFEKGRYDRRDIESRAKRQAEVLKNDAQTRSETEGQLLKQRKNSMAELEGRKMHLAAKQRVIGKSFDLALEKLSSLDEQSYLSLLEKAVERIGMDRGELLFTEKDRGAIGQKLLDRVNVQGERFTLSKDTISAKGGFVLRNGAIEVNSTLETMVSAVREEAIPEVVKVLFN